MNYDIKVSIIVPTFNRIDDVSLCVKSILESEYPNIEVIVVDNASTDNTVGYLKNVFTDNPNFKIVQSNLNLGAGGGRNLGAKYAKGHYLLFVDSDNVIDKRMVSHLVDYFEKHAGCGMVGPLMLYKKNPNIIWLYFADINMYTSQAKYKGTNEKDTGRYPEVVEVGHLPNCFMVKRNDFEQIGGFDEKYIIIYEEAELAEKIKKTLHKKIFLYSKEITYHNAELPHNKENNYSFRSEQRAYLLARNRIYFMRKNATFLQFLIFLLIFLPFSMIYYGIGLLTSKQFKMAYAYLKGTIQGFFL